MAATNSALLSAQKTRWQFEEQCNGGGAELLDGASDITVRGVLNTLRNSLDADNPSPVVALSHGDPSKYPSFRPPAAAEDAIIAALRTTDYNSYAPTDGLLSARRAVAEYLSPGIPHDVSADDVYLTVGCTQSIEVMLAILSRPGANILLPKPGYPYYESRAASSNLQVRHFNLLEERGWEVDLEDVEALCDENTAAVVIINPGNPTGAVYSRGHLEKIAETARKLGILVIADEVYGCLAFGKNPFVPMGAFGSVAPVVTMGSISKRWCVPGWRAGWIVINDPNGILKKSGITKKIMGYINVAPDPATFIQAALPCILKETKEEHFAKIVNTLRESANVCCEKIKEIPCIACPNDPQGAMSVMVKLDISLLDGISNDFEFCIKLAKEESVLVLPGTAVGLPGWLRITFGTEPSIVEDGLERVKAFCQRHSIPKGNI